MRKFILFAISFGCGLAQTPKSFEVATIKPTEMTNRGFAFWRDGTTLNYQGHSLELLILGMGVPDYRIVWPKDVGAWVRSERFDIVAKAPVSSVASQGMLGVDRPVFDKTGLTGRFDFVLNLKVSGLEVTGAGGESIFTALREQLGLKLEPGRDVIETLVIDQVERPSGN